MGLSGGRTLQEEGTASEKNLIGGVLGMFKKQQRNQMNQIKKIRWKGTDHMTDLLHETKAE